LPKLAPVTWRELVTRLKSLGFIGPFEGGKHPYMARDDGVLTIQNPHRQEIGVNLLQRILRQGNISLEDWLGSDR